MKATKIKILTGIILLSSFVFVNAQEQDERLVREMTLEREYDPTIQDANKVNRLPEVREPDIAKRTIEYSPFTVPMNPEKAIFVLPSGDIMTAIPVNNRRGYFHFGGGMYLNLNGDLGYHLLNDEKEKLNVYFSHRSTNGNVEYLQQEAKQKAVLNDNLGGLDFKHYFNPAILRLGANYGYSLFNYYGLPFVSTYYPGYLSVSPPPPDSFVWPLDDSFAAYRDINQVNQVINAYAGVQAKEEASIGYLLDFEFVRFAQKYGMAKDFEGIRENKYTLRLGFNSKFGDGNQCAGLTGKVDIFNFTYPENQLFRDYLGYKDLTATTITPYYRINGDNWKAQLGVNLMFIKSDSTTFFLSPNISIDAEIADKTIFYVNAGGEIQANDAYGLSKLNRYTDYSRMTKPSRTWLDATLGIRSGVAPDLWFDLFAGYKITENEVFFIPSPYYYSYEPVLSSSSTAPTGFASYYTTFQPHASSFRVGAALKYAYGKSFDFSVKGVYNYWMLKAGDGMIEISDDTKPYGRPAIEINADLTVRPVNPLALTLGYYLGADRYTVFPSRGQEIKMKDINDLNFTASWNFNETFGAYLKLNNLLFQKQELWYGYPMQGFNVMAGINLNF